MPLQWEHFSIGQNFISKDDLDMAVDFLSFYMSTILKCLP